MKIEMPYHRSMYRNTIPAILSLLFLAANASTGLAQIALSETISSSFDKTSSAIIRVNNATGIAGGLPATGTKIPGAASGWSTSEYGAGVPTSGFLQIQSTTTIGNQFTINLVSTTLSGDGGTPGVASNFDSTHSYSWVMFRPDTNAGTSGADNINPTLLNTGASIILKDGSNTVLANTDANLNAYIKLDTSGWNWGSIPVNQQGSFSLAFVNLYDAGANTERAIAINYTPVPEPGTVLGIAASVFGIGGLVRRRFRHTKVTADSMHAESE